MKAHRLPALLAVLCCASCVRAGTPPVPACPVGPDGAHPSSGALQVLPSEVAGVTLDSMRWQVHSGHEGEEFGTWTSLSVTGRIVSTRTVSLVGVGVLVEGLRDSKLVNSMIDSSFYEARPLPTFTQAGTVIKLELVRPERSVPVIYAEKILGSTPSPSWGCPTRARIIRLWPDSVPRREPRIPEDERPWSDFYQWNPSTFDIDSVLANGPGAAYALIEGPTSGAQRTDFAIVRTKVLYRTTDGRAIHTDSSRISSDDSRRLTMARDSALRRMPFGPPRLTRIVAPGPDESVVAIRQGVQHTEFRFPTQAPPPEVEALLTVLAELRSRAAQRALSAP